MIKTTGRELLEAAGPGPVAWKFFAEEDRDDMPVLVKGYMAKVGEDFVFIHRPPHRSGYDQDVFKVSPPGPEWYARFEDARDAYFAKIKADMSKFDVSMTDGKDRIVLPAYWEAHQ